MFVLIVFIGEDVFDGFDLLFLVSFAFRSSFGDDGVGVVLARLGVDFDLVFFCVSVCDENVIVGVFVIIGDLGIVSVLFVCVYVLCVGVILLELI